MLLNGIRLGDSGVVNGHQPRFLMVRDVRFRANAPYSGEEMSPGVFPCPSVVHIRVAKNRGVVESAPGETWVQCVFQVTDETQ